MSQRPSRPSLFHFVATNPCFIRYSGVAATRLYAVYICG